MKIRKHMGRRVSGHRVQIRPSSSKKTKMSSILLQPSYALKAKLAIGLRTPPNWPNSRINRVIVTQKSSLAPLQPNQYWFRINFPSQLRIHAVHLTNLLALPRTQQLIVSLSTTSRSLTIVQNSSNEIFPSKSVSALIMVRSTSC